MKNSPQTKLSFESLFENLPSAWLWLNSEGRIQSMNPAAERIFSLSLPLAKGQTLLNLLGRNSKLLEAVQEVLQSGRSTRLHETTLELKEKTLLVSAEIAPLGSLVGSLEKPEGALLWLSEQSLPQAFQEENRLQDRLKMMGTLASGLAHEIRNPLGGIRAAAQMLSRELKDPELQEYAAMMIRETDGLNELITQLLDFTKAKRIRKNSVNVHQLISDVLKLEENSIANQDITLSQNFDPSLPAIRAHGPSLKQALLNLIKNAIEAMPQGGTLTITTQMSGEKRLIKEGAKNSAPKNFVEVAIQDTGVGISEAEQKKLFTPFFTTKPAGTGLGLMMVQRIIQENGGSLKLESQPKQGSTFSIFLELASHASKD